MRNKLISLIAAAAMIAAALPVVSMAADEKTETLWSDNFDSYKNEVEYYHDKALEYNNKVLADGTLSMVTYEGIEGATLYTTNRGGGDDSSYWQLTKGAKGKNALTTQVSRFSSSGRGAKMEFAQKYAPTADTAIVLQFDAKVSNKGETNYDEAIQLNGVDEYEIDFVDGLKMKLDKWETVKVVMNTWGTQVFVGNAKEAALKFAAAELTSINFNGMIDGIMAGDAIKAESNPFGYPTISLDNMEIYSKAADEAPEGMAPAPTLEPTVAPTVAPTLEPTAEPTAAPEETHTLLVTNDGAINILIDDTAVVFPDAKPFIDANSRTQVPVRAVAEMLNCKVAWDETTRTVTVTDDENTITLVIDSNIMNKNGETVEMDTTATISEDRTYIPVRFVAEALGLVVDYK